jgi:hypothetical protein
MSSGFRTANGLLWVTIVCAQAAAQPATKDGKSASIRDVALAKLEAARKTCRMVAQEYIEGKATVEQVQHWSRRWLDAEREVSKKNAEALTALEGHVERMKDLEQAAQNRAGAKGALASDSAAAEYFRLGAEQALAQEKLRLTQERPRR